MRGCRAPGCTAGDPLKKLKLRAHRSQQAFLEFSVELWTSPLAKDRQAAQKLFADWQTARSRILVELISKMAFWQQFPWKPWQSGGGCGSKSLPWTLEASGRWMQAPSELPISGPSIWTRPDNPDDPPLRGIVERMARGEDISHPGFSPLGLGAAQFWETHESLSPAKLWFFSKVRIFYHGGFTMFHMQNYRGVFGEGFSRQLGTRSPKWYPERNSLLWKIEENCHVFSLETHRTIWSIWAMASISMITRVWRLQAKA